MNRTWTVAAGLAGGCVLAAFLAGLTGCTNPDPTAGYTMMSQYRPGIRTIAVPIWNRGRMEFRRDLEISLTQAVIKRIEAQTPYKVVDRKWADTILTGTLNSVEQQVLSFDPRTGQAREIQMQLSVDFTWKHLKTGEVLAERKNLKVSADYILPSPFSEDFYLGSEDALDRLSQRIVEQLAQPW